jgi:hypothetical protein
MAGGNVVTIEGEHFVPSMEVTFGETAAVNVQFVNDRKVVVVAPVHSSPGRVGVKLTTTTGSWGRYYEGYEYKNP